MPESEIFGYVVCILIMAWDWVTKLLTTMINKQMLIIMNFITVFLNKKMSFILLYNVYLYIVIKYCIILFEKYSSSLTIQ